MKTRTRQQPALPLFSSALFLSAGLMFALQPMVGKMLLPLVGGTPAGWIVTMAFFQVMLLAGYFVAHALSRFEPLVHGALYLGLMCLGGLFLPVNLAQADFAHTPGAFDVFCLLTKHLSLPFIAISATSSTLQRLFTMTDHAAADDPYFLYAASNLGSFTGLFLYPLAFEPLWGNAAQARYWAAAFVFLIVAAATCLALATRKTPKHKAAKKEKPVTGSQRIEWVLLAFFPSALLLAVTTHISTDIFSAPMIWVMPLAIYLLTFVAAFSRKPLLKYKAVARAHHIILPLSLALLYTFDPELRTTVYAMVFQLAAFGITALVCHLRLAQLRPEGKNLTDYYLMMSLGGALGGVLNAFILPVVLDRLIEYPVLMILACAVLPAFREKIPLFAKMMMGLAAFCGVMECLYLYTADHMAGAGSIQQWSFDEILGDVILFTIALMLGTNLRTACYGAAVMLIVCELVFPRDVLMTTRNFYGVIKIFDRPLLVKGKIENARYMYHGTTTHGIQIMSPQYEKMPTAYFWGGGPVSDVFALYNPKKIAVLGLGAGTMNCYSTKEREFTFLEIDDAVRRVAESEFTYLKACTGKKPPRIIIGDGRLELARLAREKFNLVVLDAFSSDTIPTHLLTLEAVKGYLARLDKGGMLLFNLSNRYFTIATPLLRIAQELGLKTRFILDVPSANDAYAAASIWFVMAPQGTSLSPLDDFGWVELQPPQDAPLWTDDHTYMLSALNFNPSLAPAHNSDSK